MYKPIAWVGLQTINGVLDIRPYEIEGFAPLYTHPKNEWINVKDKLPQQDVNVFVYDQVSHQFGISSMSIEMGDAENGDNKSYCVWEDLQFHDRDEPTHWMPLPNPPEEK